jgi:hypothetical protein
MGLPTRRACVVGREEAGDAIAVVQLSQVGCTGDDVVVRVVGIAAETIPLTQDRPGLGHDLHQTHGPLWRCGVRIAKALGAHDRFPLKNG